MVLKNKNSQRNNENLLKFEFMPREIEQFNERINRPTDFEKTVLKNF